MYRVEPIQGKRGKWRFKINDDENRMCAISNVHGWETSEEAQEAGDAIVGANADEVANWRLSAEEAGVEVGKARSQRDTYMMRAANWRDRTIGCSVVGVVAVVIVVVLANMGAI